jgi:hypothetical protein
VTSDNFYTLWLPALVALAGSLAASAIRPRDLLDLRIHALAPHLPAIAVIAGATALLGAAVLPDAGWGFTDDDVFILHYLRGDPYPPPIWPDVGRFFPMGHQEWRLLYAWTGDPVVYQSFAVVQYAAFGIGLALLLRELRAPGRLVLLFALTLPPVVVAFANLIVQERVQVLFLPWLLLALLRWDRTKQPQFALLALVAAHFMLYVKEPTVLFLAPIALLRLAPAAGPVIASVRLGDRRAVRSIARALLADLGILLSCMVFLALYFSTIPPETLFSDRVYDGRSLGADGVPEALLAWTTKEPLLIPLLAAGLWRFVVRVASRGSPDFNDQVLLGALIYFASLVASGLVSTYYGALPLFAASIAVLPQLAQRVEGKASLRAAATAAVVLLVAFNIFAGASHLAYRQDWIDRNHALTAELESLLPAEGGGRAVFLRGHSWDAEMLAVYANAYRRLGITFLVADRRYLEVGPAEAARCDGPAHRCLAYAGSPPPSAFVADLGRLERDRSATLSKAGETLWRFDDARLRDLQSIFPPGLDALARHFYAHW